MNRLQSDINESGYSITDMGRSLCLFQGIQTWAVACELHEMLLGELEE